MFYRRRQKRKNNRQYLVLAPENNQNRRESLKTPTIGNIYFKPPANKANYHLLREVYYIFVVIIKNKSRSQMCKRSSEENEI